jgi:hypothetical protein
MSTGIERFIREDSERIDSFVVIDMPTGIEMFIREDSERKR